MILWIENLLYWKTIQNYEFFSSKRLKTNTIKIVLVKLNKAEIKSNVCNDEKITMYIKLLT